MATLIQAHDNKNNNSAPPISPDRDSRDSHLYSRCAFSSSVITLTMRNEVSFGLREGDVGRIAYLPNLTRSTLAPDTRSLVHSLIHHCRRHRHHSHRSYYYSSPFSKSRPFSTHARANLVYIHNTYTHIYTQRSRHPRHPLLVAFSR